MEEEKQLDVYRFERPFYFLHKLSRQELIWVSDRVLKSVIEHDLPKVGKP